MTEANAQLERLLPQRPFSSLNKREVTSSQPLSIHDEQFSSLLF
jgi:hypothetical protein